MENAIVVTGANRGIGYEIARALARSGATVVMACRDLAKARPAQDAIIRESGNDNIELLALDLASPASIRSFVAALAERRIRIRVLINNAGILCDRFETNAEGREVSLAVNYLGPALLSLLIIPLMSGPKARIINTGSLSYRIGHIEDDFFSLSSADFHPIRRYSDTKLALILFSLELARRLEGRGISVHAIDPGIVNTGMITMHRWFDPLTDIFFRPLISTEEEGAVSAIALAGREAGEGPASFYVVRGRGRRLPRWVRAHRRRDWLWAETVGLLGQASFSDAGL